MFKSYYFFVAALFILCSSVLYAQTEISGTIDANTTWTKSESPYLVTGDLTVAAGVTLTIQPGVVVKMKDYYTEIYVDGKISAVGTASENIVFTAWADDTHGGDTNEDGNASSPDKDQWGGVVCRDESSGNVFHYCWFGYGGGYATAGLLEVKNSDAEVRYCTFTKSSQQGMYLENSAIDVQHSSFTDNTNTGIYYEGLHSTKNSILNSNQFELNLEWSVYGNLNDCTSDIILEANSTSGSKRGGFGMKGNIAGQVTFTGQNDFPFIVAESDVQVNEGGSLAITEGTLIKFQTHYADLMINGSMSANGTSANSVIFTSLADDSHGGDSNADGTATVPEPNQWGGIILNDASTGNFFHHCYFGYGGGYATSGILEIKGSDAEIRNCTFNYSDERGIYSENAALDIQNSSFTGNKSAGIYYSGLDSIQPSVLSNNQFTDNEAWAVNGNLLGLQTSITCSGNSSNGSPHNGFGMTGDITENVELTGQSDFPFIIAGSDVSVAENKTLTIAAGTTVKFDDHYSDLLINGKLLAVGTSTDPIAFTSLKDDAHGGDTNGDEVLTEPAPNQWGGVILSNTSTGNNFHHCYFGYGGGYSTSGILEIKGSDAEIRNCTFNASDERGIYSENAALDIQNSNFTGNKSAGIYYNGLDSVQSSVLINNQFTDNVNWAVNGNLQGLQKSITLNGNSSAGSQHNGFGMVGGISENVELTGQSDFPFIIAGSDVSVDENKTLTITAGTTVKFDDHYSDLLINGKFLAVGTSTDPIAFTSLKDDAHGGDTNGDEVLTEPAPDQWGGVILSNTSTGNKLHHCYFGYGGGYSTSGILEIKGSEAEVRNCTFHASSQRGIYLESAALDIQNSIFSDNQWEGIYYNGLHSTQPSVLNNNQFTDNVNWAVNGNLQGLQSSISLSGNNSSGSHHNGFGVIGEIAGEVDFNGQSDFPFIIAGSDVSVAENKTLTISAGTTVKFDDYYSDLHIYGTLNATGTAGNSIVFTSITDDAHGGDTNGDAGATSPAPDAWGGIIFYETSNSNHLQYCWLGYGGGWTTNTNLKINTSGVTIDNITSTKASGNGIEILGANPSVRSSDIVENIGNGIYTNSGALPTLLYNSFAGNGNQGVHNADAGVEVDATYNWWGDASGPYHADKNPSGQGVEVSDHVLFEPWNVTTNAIAADNSEELKIMPVYQSFNGQLSIPFELAANQKISMRLISIDGKVLQIFRNRKYPQGRHQVHYNVLGLSNSIYIIQLTNNNVVATRKIVIKN
jgi:hypothetical protein